MVDVNELRQAQQIDAMKKQLLGKAVTKEGLERLGRVRTVNPELAAQAELYILQIMQAGKLNGPVTDSQMKDVLRVLAERKDFKIERK
jgi:DNA-binding TFAR19-related protein (PDSD5 family)